VAGGCAIVLALAVGARAQVRTWRSSETLWNHALSVTTGNFRAYAGLAEVAASRGDLAFAIAHYKEAVRLAPDNAEWHFNLALLLVEGGDLTQAEAEFRNAIQLRPDAAESHNSLGALLARRGSYDEAFAAYRRALDLRRDYPLAHRNLGLAHAATGHVQAGIDEMLEALRLAPGEGQWHYEAAAMLLHVNRRDEAMVHLKETLRLVPGHEGARAMLR
jgi:Flp pilus assembly protein TadD